ncbi:hypothetical protein [Geothrix sp. 21YS21S-2]|uniref:FitA-like ribbon-helix-helix domain-containing protein n=1 Tax=Geothrix sp. 21YS21S-2 TaxID=3068893 RepID=UPI0027B9F141|nr:hypothetical protein [Geothrix sp. 21YS21S-2]
MTQLLIQDVKEESIDCLRIRATLHGWNVQTEAKAILEHAAAVDEVEALRGWGQNLPVMDDGEELDSVGLLQRYMSDMWPDATA